MKILIFTEGTILMPKEGSYLSREELEKLAKERSGSIKDYASYIPVGSSVEKLKKWAKNADLIYITSRRKLEEIEIIRGVLNKFDFPKGELVYRQGDEQYKDVAERIMPHVLVEDDCECIGGEPEMVYPHIRSDLKSKIKSVVVKEFEDISYLPDRFFS